jgi:hypothetical protein
MFQMSLFSRIPQRPVIIIFLSIQGQRSHYPAQLRNNVVIS